MTEKPELPDFPAPTGERSNAAYWQCLAVAQQAKALAEVHESMAKMLSISQLTTEIVGERSAEFMKTLGDWLNGMDASTDDDDWMDEVFDNAQLFWPAP